MFRNSLLIVLFGIITVYFHPLKASVTYSDSGSQTVENLVYQSVVSEGYAKVTGLASGNVTAIKIPETVTLEVQRTVTDTEGKTTTDYVSMKFPVREIASNAFSGKKTLASVLFNNNLVTIGSTAFANCIGLSGTLQIPASVTSIGSGAFSGSGIRELGFGDGSKLVELGNYAFSDCENLLSAKIPNRLAEIPESAFARSGLTEISILSPSTTKIGKQAFWKCVNLKTILLHKDIQEIDTMAFSSCGNFKDPINLTFPENVTSLNIRCRAFEYAHIKVLTFSTGTFKIEEYAFCRNNNLEQLRFPTENINITLGEGAFFQCRNLKDFKMPEGLTRIENGCFYECESLRDILLPKSVNYLGALSFGCIKELNSAKRSWCPECNSDVVLDNQGAFYESGISICLTCVNYDEKTKKHKDMSKSLSVAPSRATGRGGVIFGEDACWRCSRLIHLPPDIISIGKNAFYGCYNLSWIPMTENYVIPDFAYQYSGIESADIKPTVYEIGKYAFANTSNLHEITLPDSLKTIKEGAFYHNDFRIVDLPSKVDNIGSKAFMHDGGDLLEHEYEDFLMMIEENKASMDEDEFNEFYDYMIKNSYFGIEEVISHNPVPPVMDGEDVFTAFIYKYAVLHVPADAIEAYKAAPVWSLFEKIYPIGSSGIDGIYDNKGVISIENGILSISNVAMDCPVEIYTVSGMLIKSQKGEGEIAGLARGLYIVRIGADVRKIWL